MMQIKTLQDALHEAREDLSDVQTQFDLLEERKRTLEILVDSLSKMLATSSPYLQVKDTTFNKLVAVPPAEVPVWDQPNNMPVWKAVELILSNSQRPMTVPEILAALRELRVSTSPESIRVAMFRKPKVFERASPGYYTLYGFSEELKREAS